MSDEIKPCPFCGASFLMGREKVSAMHPEGFDCVLTGVIFGLSSLNTLNRRSAKQENKIDWDEIDDAMDKFAAGVPDYDVEIHPDGRRIKVPCRDRDLVQQGGRWMKHLVLKSLKPSLC